MTASSADESRVSASRSRLAAEVGFRSERGSRSENEDYVGAFGAGGASSVIIAAVADGVGGAKGGRVAAELTVRAFVDGCVQATEPGAAKEAALRSLQVINHWVHALGRRDAALDGMASTFTGLICVGRQAHVFHVGDSRLYRLRGDRLEQLTTDHTLGPGQHIITRAIGAEADVRIEYVALENERSDRFLLCTDGVHEGVGERAMLQYLGRRASPQDAADEIVNAALAAPVGDNATALVLDVLELPPMDYPALAARFVERISDLPQRVGHVIDGFHLDELLSDGRYTRVFRATDQIEARQVVIKFPKPLTGADRVMREAFARESWIASCVQSPFVGEVLQVPSERQTQLYLALPFYAGETLESRLKRSPPISLATGTDIAVKLAKGIAALHRAGIIHRDIKPDNVVILPPAPPLGTGIKLVDFGVARLRQSADPHGTAEPGTPSYMAPELFDGKPADEKSDQFALGVTVYRQFSGRFPYGEIEPFSHPVFRAPASLLGHRPDLPAWLDRIIARAIAVSPNDRYQDVLEFMFELEHGADRASPIVVERKPLYHRNPLLFWKIISAVLAMLLLASLALPRISSNSAVQQRPGSIQQKR
ncbi:MAG: bifunctional protein-serine/threonine kinase/phosphatase [Xanthobacteraceae bacterium]|nr:bifunctional protein-serine/threonine kinase/phosphatase [Xanthobacteraceae bacterium]